MKLKRLEINGFKNLKEFKIDFEKRDSLTLLIGNNGSGKSNLIEAISEIFASLYKAEKASFYYELIYDYDETTVIHINYKKGIKRESYVLHMNGRSLTKETIKNYLPSKIIASYSGEEDRLWKNYYEDFYDKYKTQLVNKETPIQPLIYINKYYWNIALLTLMISDIDISEIIGNKTIKEINFRFNATSYEWFRTNDNLNFVTGFVNVINDKENYTYEEFKEKIGDTREYQLFQILSLAYLPKEEDHKLIENIEIIFSGDEKLTSNELSEGEKKQLLLKLMIEIIATDDKVLILLDEPDSNIHVANKAKLKDLFYNNGKVIKETILTSHSPTLTHCFDDKHIAMFDNEGHIENIETQHIISSLTNDMWTYQEQNVFLSSLNGIDLLVEGEFDKKHIETAIKKDNLGEDYPDLKFNIYDLKSCSNQMKFFDGLCNADNLRIPNRKIIFIFDNEKQFINDNGSLKGKEFHGTAKMENNLYRKNNIYLVFLPKKDAFINNFTIENMYDGNKYKECLLETMTRRSGDENYFNDFIDNISDGIKEDTKRLLAQKCTTFSKVDFEHFNKLFILINKIKDLPIQE